MENKELTSNLKEILCNEGANLAGCADLSFQTDLDWKYGVVAAVPIPAEIVEMIVKWGPTKEYFDAYHEAERKLTDIAMAGEKFLISKGYQAYAQISARIREDGQWRTKLPHKTVATNAGLGWIGKSCLLVTEEYGSAVRLVSILTDAPLECGRPIRKSRCGSCRYCVEACPAHALSGILWTPEVDRDEIVDKESCLRMQVELTRKNTGYEKEFLCGKCFAVCPYTQRYLNHTRQ